MLLEYKWRMVTVPEYKKLKAAEIEWKSETKKEPTREELEKQYEEKFWRKVIPTMKTENLIAKLK